MKKNKKTLIAAIPLFLIVILVFAGFGVWKKYRDTLMQNQEEQMLLTTRILSENMAMSAEEYEESLSFLAKTAENRPQDEAKQLYREFIDTQTSFITNLYLEDEQGKLSESVKDVQIVSSQLLTQSSAKNSIYMEKDTDGKIYNVYKRVLKDGRKICLMIDAEKILSETDFGNSHWNEWIHCSQRCRRNDHHASEERTVGNSGYCRKEENVSGSGLLQSGEDD